MLQFEFPWLLLLLLALPLLWFRPRRTAAVAFAAMVHITPQQASLKQRCSRYLPMLRIASLALLLMALAQPTLRPSTARNVTEGLAIEIVLDRSASMATADMQYDGVLISRMDAVKRVARDFIFGAGSGLKGRPNDLIGVIGFAADPITFSPLTLSHGVLRRSIENLQVATTLQDDGTNIGDALALAAARLHMTSKQGVKGKLIVLVTDGENNLGERTPAQAGELARNWGIKIYAMTIRPDVVVPWRDQQIEYAMWGLAASTGGLGRVVKDASDLREFHREIDRLEPAHLESLKRSDGDRALTWVLFLALLFLVAELALKETWLRKAPE